ncbi:MAG TPA: hypothetical protein VGM30_09370 [Puia sp.]|jgi:hypothetical protein
MKKIPNSLPPAASGHNAHWWVVLPALALVWTLFKWAYPFPDFFVDSYTYIRAAAAQNSISYRPIGYSLFLRLVHSVSAGDGFLVTLQYALVQSASLYLFFSLRRWFKLSLKSQRILLAFVVLNPLVLYVSNCVSSDALFTALSLFWITALLELVRRPSWWKLIGQAILLALIFTIRYNALYYPVVTAAAFLLCERNVVYKTTGIVAGLLVVVLGTLLIKDLTRQQTGAAVFSAFSGWQMANNALNMYPYIHTDTTILSSPEGRQLTGLVQRYFDSAGASFQNKTPSATTVYMWEQSSPLYQYFDNYRRIDHLSYFAAWNRVSPLFSKYGYALVRKHPIAFGRYYCLPSARRFFLPPLEVFAKYDEGKDTIDAVARDWFRYRTNRVRAYSATVQAVILEPVSWLFLVLNGVFVVTAILVLRLRSSAAGIRSPGSDIASPAVSIPSPGSVPDGPPSTIVFKLIVAYFLANAGFCIFAAPNELRYQPVPLILLFLFTVCGLSAKIKAKINR